jgi:hypothetical protein
MEIRYQYLGEFWKADQGRDHKGVHIGLSDRIRYFLDA